LTVVSLPFLLIFCVATLALRSPFGRTHRLSLLAIASLIFALASTEAVGDAVCLLAMAATGWFAVMAVRRNKNAWLLAGCLTVIILEFVAIRQVLPHEAMSSWPLYGPVLGSTIGLSYVMFRILHLIVDAHGDELPADVGLLPYLTYLFCYLTFLAGPIQRFPDFADGCRGAPVGPHLAAIRRFGPTIVGGFFKFAVIAGLFFELFNWTQAPGNGWPPAVDLALGLLAYAIYLYASFSGYTDIVRGFGGLVGLVPPENFDRPYLSADFLDLWSRWHISLSEWFKLYVFNPLTKALIAVDNRPAVVPYLGALGFFVTFLLMGLWHGLSPRYVLYGLMLGLGVSLNKLYQVAMGQWLGRRGYQALSRQSLYAAVARTLAVGYFVLALAFLWLVDPAAAGTPIDWLAATGLLLLSLLVLCTLADRVRAFDKIVASPAATMIQLALLLIYLFGAHETAPPLLYQFF
jgi:D-alanyl-lipoteichoic acid acyltransferase DltB (MBOAT superfamily)